MRTAVIAAFASMLGILWATGGYAEDSSSTSQSAVKKSINQLKSACKTDVDKLCSDVTPGEGRIVSCLRSKEDRLSPSCKKAWSSANARISERMDKAEVAFRKECGSDVQKYCSNVPSGRGRILDCLSQHEDDLSGSCKDFRASVEQRLEQLFG